MTTNQDPGARAPNATTRPAGRAADLKPETTKKDYHGMPEGYEPDKSVTYKKGKAEDGSEDTLVDAKGNKTAVSPFNPAQAQATNITNLDPNHTYRDRVEAQAKDLGIEIDPAWTMEYLLWLISVKGSS